MSPYGRHVSHTRQTCRARGCQWLPVKRASPSETVECGNRQHIVSSSVDLNKPQITYSTPDVRALARQLRPLPSYGPTPDVKSTALLLRAESSYPPAPILGESNIPFPVRPSTDIVSTARNLRAETVDFPVPDIRSTARALRQVDYPMLTPCRDDDVVADDAVEVMVVDDEVMVVDDDVSSCLSFTETMQASYCPVNMNDEDVYSRAGCNVCKGLKNIKLDSLRRATRISMSRRKTKYGPVAKAIIRRVRHFFEELKRRLGRTKTHTILDSPRDLTSVACGVSRWTASAVGEAITSNSAPLSGNKKPAKSRKAMRAAVLKKYEESWGEKVRQAIHDKLKEDSDVTVSGLRDELCSRYESFKMSLSTLYRFVKSLGFSYRINRGQRLIYDNKDIVAKRSVYLRKIAQARNGGDCLIYIDETWIFDKMVKKRGWNDTTIPRWARSSILQKYSCGRTAGKNKGRRATVISALGEDGVVPNCTKIVVSGGRGSEGDPHGDMDHHMFEQWLRDSIPHMIRFADGRRVTIIMDNAPYHTRQLEKIPTRSSTKAQLTDFLRSRGIEVADEISKADLIAEFEHYVESRGGLSRVRKFAVEEICDELGVRMIRLPPFHPFFNPIELCWSQLKSHLNKYGSASDRIETVKVRATHWLKDVQPSMAAAWFRHTQYEENDARIKELLDAADEEQSTDTTDTDSSQSSTEYDSDVSMESCL